MVLPSEKPVTMLSHLLAFSLIYLGTLKITSMNACMYLSRTIISNKSFPGSFSIHREKKGATLIEDKMGAWSPAQITLLYPGGMGRGGGIPLQNP